jgi:hypothetical protein
VTEPPVLRVRLTRGLWRVYAALAMIVALVALTHYVNVYDDYDISPRLDSAGELTRLALNVVSFPLGQIVGVAFDGPLARAFACDGVATHPCAVFIHWWTHVAAIVAQSLLLLWGARRLTRDRLRD